MVFKDNHLDLFRRIKCKFIKKTRVPHLGTWKSYSNNDIWLDMICQVIVVGGSAPADKFFSNNKILRQVSYNRLSKMESKIAVALEINKALRAVGTRYASKNVSKCMKSNALVHNFNIIKKSKNGAKGLLERLSQFDGPNKDIRKIKYIMKVFEFMKSKSARDFLMEKGIVRNAIAIDIRIQNIFKSIGLKFPDGFATDTRIYDKVEKEILENVCKPLKLDGVQFDRMLYQNYEDIIVFIKTLKAI